MKASQGIEIRNQRDRHRPIGGLLGALLAAAILLCGSATTSAAPIEASHTGVEVGARHLSIPEVGGFPTIHGRDAMVAPRDGFAGSQAGGQPEQIAATPLVSLPAPAALWLFGSGLCALGLARRRSFPWRRHKARRDEAPAVARFPAHTRDWRLALRERMRHASRAQFSNAGGGDSCSGSPPGAFDGRGGAGDPPPRASVTGLMQRRFEELAAALVEQPNVAPGRGFGCSCIKYGKRPFLAFDEQLGGIAFRVGEQSAADLLAEFSLVEHWNPKQERQPKRSWLVCRVSNGEALVQLAAAAYEYALAEVGALVTSGERPAAELASA